MAQFRRSCHHYDALSFVSAGSHNTPDATELRTTTRTTVPRTASPTPPNLQSLSTYLPERLRNEIVAASRKTCSQIPRRDGRGFEVVTNSFIHRETEQALRI